MASSGLSVSYPLTTKGIDGNVTRRSAGAYALGYRRDDKFYIKYVGRSDKDVNDRLLDHIGEKSDYKRFRFKYYSSAKAAFEKECHLYHDFKPRDNTNHPARPNNSNWECPVCDIFD